MNFNQYMGLEVIVIPTHKEMIRKDQPDKVLSHRRGKI